MKKDKIVVDGKKYDVYIYQEQRNDARVSIGKTGIHIRIPAGIQREEQFKEILRLKRWAGEQIKQKPLETKTKGWRTYNDGDALRVGNDEYLIRLNFNEKQSSSAKAIENTFYLDLSSILPQDVQQKHISVLLSRLIGQKKIGHIKEKIDNLNKKHFNFNVGKIFLKYNTSNWGSCSQSNNINISTRLLFAPEEVVDYVCIHELVHLQEKNHSSEFWRQVEQVMPDYKEKEKWLKENSHNCWF